MKGQLILEGGGMRGVYTAGVLDYFLEQDLRFLSIIGVSAGSCNATSYLANQKGRQGNTFIKYSRNKDYLSFRNFVRTGSFMGMDFIFKTLQNDILPFDYDAFHKNLDQLEVVVTDVDSGRAVYHQVSHLPEDVDYLIASCSLPLISKIVHIDTNKYLDGGMADPIPLAHSIESGFEKQVIVLTRDRTYRKKENKRITLEKISYRRYPHFLETLKKRNHNYNQTLEQINILEKQGKVFVIAPSEEMLIDRYAKDEDKLQYYYNLGYNDARTSYQSLKVFLQDVENVASFIKTNNK